MVAGQCDSVLHGEFDPHRWAADTDVVVEGRECRRPGVRDIGLVESVSYFARMVFASTSPMSSTWLAMAASTSLLLEADIVYTWTPSWAVGKAQSFPAPSTRSL